ncbi:branched-chain amino acid ABC transporter permease [Streptomyces sp. NPDC051940]|uniref:branched-chain amino acid ABC transporter permease n=1 Tax=Streptomyces sp. NPDC051940 TaxID=3155675 RepID=UPI00343A1781
MSDVLSRLKGRTATRSAWWLLLLLPPFYLSTFWLQTGLFAMAFVIAAIGLNLLVGTAGQLSLGHAFFLAVGAYGYIWLADEPHDAGATSLNGLGLPPLLALIGAVLLAGLAGAAFSPVSGRLKLMYLGVATMALVFIGGHVMLNATSVTGGFNGRSVPAMELFGLPLDDSGPDVVLLGVPFGALERLWYFGLLLVALALFTARNLLNGRAGRALGALRDSEVAASVMGVHPARHRAAAFTVSSMYAGAGGALLALAVQRVVPEQFGLLLSMDLLAMIVIGGLGSAAGAAAGAVFVAVLPQVLGYYAADLPLIDPPGTPGGFSPAEVARFLYGAALVLVLLFIPGGLVSLRLPAWLRGRLSTLTPTHKEHNP